MWGKRITALWGLASFALGLAVKSERNGGSKRPPYEKRMTGVRRWDTGTVLGLINQGDA